MPLLRRPADPRALGITAGTVHPRFTLLFVVGWITLLLLLLLLTLFSIAWQWPLHRRGWRLIEQR
jgi:hypothetical protein